MKATPIIDVKELTKIFGQTTAVNNLSFSVQEGEVFAFLGPNGAGKTTTIKMLTTLLRPTAGHILVNGYDPVRQQDEVRKSFGIVFQDSSVDEELTAWENMEFHGILYGIPRQTRTKRISGLLEIVGLIDRKDSFVKTFSGGMRRRLEIARGLLHHPRILFLDEPTLGLDPQTRINIWEQINKLNRDFKTTIFFTTHYLEEAQKMATKIAIIDKGTIVASGTVASLLKETATETLEAAYLAITGRDIREEAPENQMHMHMRMRRMGRR